jgi:threonine dehydratase
MAGALKEKQLNAGKKIGIVLTGGNVDRQTYAEVLAANI